jgi:hypothetical protein
MLDKMCEIKKVSGRQARRLRFLHREQGQRGDGYVASTCGTGGSSMQSLAYDYSGLDVSDFQNKIRP